MKQSIILLSFVLSACVTIKAPAETLESEEVIQSNTFQVNEDTGILCKNNHSIACNEIRDYCFNNTADSDCMAFNQEVGKENE